MGSWGTQIAVLLVDDHRVFAEVLAMRLRGERGIGEVEIAFSIGTARAMANLIHPDVVLLDYDLAGESGLDLIAQLEEQGKRPPVVMVSAGHDPRLIVEALERGAEAWVPKDAGFDVLLGAVAEVLRGHLYLPPEALRSVVERLVEQAHGPTTPEHSFVDDLSSRELEVLRCLVSGMTRVEVAQRLFISTNTVRTHVQNVLKAAELHSTLALVAAARERGVTGIDDEPHERVVERRTRVR
jgi:two-component system nitrate/nitrite response regulator NarL